VIKAFSGFVYLKMCTFSFVHSKHKTPVLGNATRYGCETKTGVVCILVIFQDRPVFSHII